jgi:hypothetical protein
MATETLKEEVLRALCQVWMANPEWRLTQLLRNVACDPDEQFPPGLYNLRDEQLLARLTAYGARP